MLGNATIGDVSVGLFDITVGDGASESEEAYVFIDADAGTGDAVVGNVTLGGIKASLGTSGELTYTAEINVTGNSTTALGGNASIGDIAYGIIDVSVSDDSADVLNDLDVNAVAGSATVGSISVTSVDVVVNDGATSNDIDILDVGVSASSSGSVTVGEVTVGDVNIDVSAGGDVDANIDYFIS